MGRYKLKDGKVTAGHVYTKKLEIGVSDENDGVYTAPYIKLYSPAKGASARYLYLGTAGVLTISDVAPVGTSGAFADVGTAV